ncbi:hypothetical protein [Streptomyces sp. NPDC060184]|uniref:hypothetical protein n=1 Tax=Streptomyces sp. NPDC060184 TaxID=3347064 RepID=UPI00365ECE49
MPPRTPRTQTEPTATVGRSAPAARRVRRAAALPMPDGASMSPLAPADSLEAGRDDATMRSLTSVLAAARTEEKEPEGDPATWRPRGTNEAGPESSASAGSDPAAVSHRRPVGRMGAKVAERPFLVAAAVAGAVVASTPFMTSHSQDRSTTYEGMGKADPIAVESGGNAGGHTDGYGGLVSIPAPGEATTADNLLDPGAGDWHGTSASAAGGTAAETPVVPGVLAAEDSGTPTPTPTPTPVADTGGRPVIAAGGTAAAGTPDGGSTKATEARTHSEAGAVEDGDKNTDATPAKTSVKTTDKADDKPATASAGTTVAARSAAPSAATANPETTVTSGADAETAAATTDATTTDDTAADATTDAAPASARIAETVGDTTADPVGDTTADPVGDTTADPVGDTTADPVGDTTADAAPQETAAPQWDTKTFATTFTVRAGESVSSDRMSLTMRADGDLVITDEDGTVRWSSGTTGENNAATFKADGELVIRSAYQQTLWSSHTGGHTGAELVIQSDGDVTILSADDQALWAAGTQH